MCYTGWNIYCNLKIHYIWSELVTKFFCILFFVFYSIFSYANLNRPCQSLFLDVVRFSDSINVMFDHELKLTMAYELKPGSKTLVLSIHGLGDDMNSSLLELTQFFENDGHQVLKVDLLGHGKSLEAHQLNYSSNPALLGDKENIAMIKKILSQVDVQEIIIIGHSLGGGLAIKLAEELQNDQSLKIKVNSVHAMAPYVQRIDKFIKQYMSSPLFLVDQIKLMLKFSVSGDLMEKLWSPIIESAGLVNFTTTAFKNNLSHQLGIQNSIDFLTDPFVTDLLRASYRYHMIAQDKVQGRTSSLLSLNARIDAALATTRQFRGMDFLDGTKKIPEFKFPVHIMGGSLDSVVIPEQLRLFLERLILEKAVYRFDEIKGADHFFPRTHAAEVYENIKNFISEMKSN